MVQIFVTDRDGAEHVVRAEAGLSLMEAFLPVLPDTVNRAA
jgi:hypothetical protein